ncbi:MAG: diphosphomevalonate decarboxylase, partial [Gammaproteobacteria bacterium]|nr:diphosphomevalonate decarboxylase [Gammaproteobacteria bacterium]
GPGNNPATPSLSVTLAGLTTRTRVREARQDRLIMNGARAVDAKIDGFLTALRREHDVPQIEIDTENDFLTRSGLASSASGFAALITAIDRAFDLGLDDTTRSKWARMGSGSAARSIFGGFAMLHQVDGEWIGEALLDADAFPLEVVLALTTRAPKKVGSTEGMERSRTTSPYFDNWVASTQTDFSAAKDAVLGHDFQKLATIAEHSCLKMHALMMSTLPGLIYWNGGTLEAIHTLRALRDDGVEVFFTVDAGPQVKAICPAGHSARVRQALDALDGVEETLVTALGPGAI